MALRYDFLRGLCVVGLVLPLACAEAGTTGNDFGATGGTASGGSSSAGASSGGSLASGGSTTGGASSGGATSGGASSGGAASGGTGGAESGGTGGATGGASSGGTGGVATGGTSSGGTGGSATGGDASGGSGGTGGGSNAGSITIGSISHLVAGSSSVAASVDITWSDAGLVLDFEVLDSVLKTDGDTRWQDDGVEIYIDLNNSKDGTYQSGDFQITAPYQGSGTSTAGGLGNTSNFSQIVIENGTVSGGYSIKVTIPWSALQTTSAVLGTTIGLDVAINDDNDGDKDRDGQLWWNANSDQAYNNPSTWGTLSLTN